VDPETHTERAIDGDAPGGDREQGTAAAAESPDARLERLTAERDALRARLAEAEQQLAELPALRAARNELRDLRSSASWRLTAPLRGAGNSVRRELTPALRVAAKRALIRLAARVRDAGRAASG
jgi:hypothetical protein